MPDPIAPPRHPVAAGRFYEDDPAALRRTVSACLALAAPREAAPTILAMAPHAGYVFSGQVAGRTLGQANLADTVLLLGPNHTGRGARLSLWTEGDWEIPGDVVPVDVDLAQGLLAAAEALTADRAAHLGEHSLEVLLPFLRQARPACRIVPLAVAEPHPDVLFATARNMAGVIAGRADPVSIVVSSDMSHYVSHETAKKLDSMALSRVLALDPAGLLQVVREAGITMCGVLPMALGLAMALELGAREARLAAYATSAEASGDYGHVVGYAGVLVS